MQHLLILFRAINILRGLLYPILRPIFLLLPFARVRVQFEAKNLKDPACISFKEQGLCADVAFEVSSEGELEQIIPILDGLLPQGIRCELLYASPSVEGKCQKLFHQYPEQIRLLRMPLLSYFPLGLLGGQSLRSWLTSKSLILCRYDFYPELILHGRLPGHRLILLSATLKSKRRRLQWHAWREWYNFFYRLFDLVVCATEDDVKQMLKLGLRRDRLITYDFRVVQILSRLRAAEDKLHHYPFWREVKTWLGKLPREKRLIVGSAWPVEMKIFSHPDIEKDIKSGELAVVLAPHRLDAASIEILRQEFKNSNPGLGFYVLPREPEAGEFERLLQLQRETPGVFVITTPGILVEMYTEFGHAYVAGGHGRSIHSVLEPFWAGAQVYCGPKTHRSTEVDLINEVSPGALTVVNELEEFGDIIKRQMNPSTPERRMQLGSRFESVYDSMLERVMRAGTKEETC